MIPKNRTCTHPGEMLLKEFMEPLGLSVCQLAKKLSLSESQLQEIVDGEQRLSEDSAKKLSKIFGTTTQFWLNLQNRYDA